VPLFGQLHRPGGKTFPLASWPVCACTMAERLHERPRFGCAPCARPIRRLFWRCRHCLPCAVNGALIFAIFEKRAPASRRILNPHLSINHKARMQTRSFRALAALAVLAVYFGARPARWAQKAQLGVVCPSNITVTATSPNGRRSSTPIRQRHLPPVCCGRQCAQWQRLPIGTTP